MIYIVREYWGPKSEAHGKDEDLSDASRIEAPDAETAAEQFAEEIDKNGNLSEWLPSSGGNEFELLTRAEGTDVDVVVVVCVDWSPNFTAFERPRDPRK